MNDFASKIEALEHRWMRAWINRDTVDMKKQASRDLIVLFGGDKSSILDRASWLDATSSRLRCSGYRFGTVYVRRHGSIAVFAAPVELEATLDGRPLLNRPFFINVWRRSSVRRRWHLIERVMTGQTADADLPDAVRSMQLWR